MKNFFYALLATFLFTPFCILSQNENMQGIWEKTDLRSVKTLSLTELKVSRDTMENGWYIARIYYQIRVTLVGEKSVRYVICDIAFPSYESIASVPGGVERVERELAEEVEDYNTLFFTPARDLQAFMNNGPYIRFLAKKDYVEGKMFSRGEILWFDSNWDEISAASVTLKE